MVTENPIVSVIIPTYNRCEDLKRCLDSVMRQTFNDFEIIVIDNGSTDGTISLLQKYPVKVIKDDTKNLPHLFNTACRGAAGNIIAFINDDAEAVPFWLENIVKTFSDFEDAGAVGGPTVSMRKQEIFSLYESGKRSMLLGFVVRMYDVVVCERKLLGIGTLCENGAFGIGSSLPFSTKLNSPITVDLLSITNMAVKKDMLWKIGRFDENFKFESYDGDFLVRVRKAGFKLIFHPRAIVWHYVNPQGATRSAYHLARDKAYAWMKNVRPRSLSAFISFVLNIFFYNLFWLYKAYQQKSVAPLRGLVGFCSGITYYIKYGRP